MLTALVALVPLALAIILLIVFRQNSRVVGLVTLGTTIFLTMVFPPFRLSPPRIALSLATGAAGSLVLLTVLLPAVFFFQIQQAGGAMKVLIDGIMRLTADRDLLMLLLVFGLAPFLDTVCGMSVGIFVIAPMLIALGISPLRAACLSMISQVTANWGSMGVVTTLVASSTGVPSSILGGDSAVLLFPATLSLCILALPLSGRGFKGIVDAWQAILGTTAILTVGAWICARLAGVELVGMLTSLATMAFIALLGRVQTVRPALQDGSARRQRRVTTTRVPFWKAGLPYVVLTAFLLLSRIIKPLQAWLQTNAVLTVPQIKLAFPLLYLPGFWLLVMAYLAICLLRLRKEQIWRSAATAWKQFAPSALAIVSFLAAAQAMQDSGMVATFGSVAATLGGQYLWVAPWLGALSGWATGSAISGNSLFASLQKSVAQHAGLPVPWIIAAQNTTAAIGKILSPPSAIVAVSAANIPSQEGQALSMAGPPVLWSIALLMALLGVITSFSSGTLTLLILVVLLPAPFILLRRAQPATSPAHMAARTLPSYTFHSAVKQPALAHMGRRSRDLLTHLAQSPTGMSRSQLCAALGQRAIVVHRLLQTLQEQGYVSREAVGGQFRLGPALVTSEMRVLRPLPTDTAQPARERVVTEAATGQERRDAASWARLLPYIEELAERVQEVAYLAVLEKGQAVPVAVASPRRLLCLSIETGSPLPLHTSGCGRVLRAYQPVLQGTARGASAGRAVAGVEQSALEAQLVRQRGYAIDDEELEDGVRSFAVPVYDSFGTLIAALAISGPASRLPLQGRGTLIEELRHTSAALTEALRDAKVG